jgi:tripeptide aminopeptidase
MARRKVTDHPKTTFNVGVLSGRTSVNSIPFKVSTDVDLRSE